MTYFAIVFSELVVPAIFALVANHIFDLLFELKNNLKVKI